VKFETPIVRRREGRELAFALAEIRKQYHPDRSVRVFATRILCGWADAQWRDLLSVM
jgi:hypothetical protein